MSLVTRIKAGDVFAIGDAVIRVSDDTRGDNSLILSIDAPQVVPINLAYAIRQVCSVDPWDLPLTELREVVNAARHLNTLRSK
jgi:hypothetical protein